MITSATPIFATADILSTVEFYEKVLGFGASWTYGDPPSFGSVSCGSVTIMFCLQPDLAKVVTGHQHWINVEEVDELYASHLERGAMIVSPPEDKPWGRREYTVQDPSGYHLRFAGNLSDSVTPSRPFPEGVSVVRRLPTAEEHITVAGKEFYPSGVPEGVLGRTWRGVVALGPEGQAIGTVRIMYDAPGWFSIWDVGVLPDWQGQRIGEAMMKEALSIVREESPGAWVYLFTYKHGFYERLGFGKETVSMMRA